MTIIVKPELLNPDYPIEAFSEVLYPREEQIKQLNNIFKEFGEYGHFQLSLVLGLPGTGKTTFVRYVAYNYLKSNPRYKEVYYINCKNLSGRAVEKTLFFKLYKPSLFNEFELKDIQRNKSWSYGITRIFEKEKDRRVALIFDEVDYPIFLKNSIGDRFLHSLIRIPESTGNLNVSILLITNKLKFRLKLSDEVRQFLFYNIKFPPYHTGDLLEIVKRRATFSLKKGSWDIDVLAYLVKKVVEVTSEQNQGNARYVIKALRYASILADEQHKDKIDYDTVDMAIQQIKRDSITDDLRTIPLSHLVTIKAMILLHREKSKLRAGLEAFYPPEMSSSEILHLTNKILSEMGKKNISYRNLNYILSDLQKSDIIKKTNTVKNKYLYCITEDIDILEKAVDEVLKEYL